jgi:predicted alpha/beta-fold hydrolase
MGYVGYMPSKNAILIVMRGTKDIRNWLEDFSFKMVNYAPCRGCLIHEGFYYSYQSIYTKFHAALVKLTEMYPNAKIVATGSSLGGALATVAAL